MDRKTLLFLGPQGSGKGTQVQLLKEALGKRDPNRVIVHFEAGGALRAFSATQGYTQDLVNASLARGELQPLFVTGFVMAQAFISSMKGDEHLIVDGFPRSLEQLSVFDSAMKFYKREKPTLLYVNVSDEECIKRLLKRGRSDDTEESIRNRLSWTRNQVMPTVEWFRKNPEYQVIDVDGERTVEEIHQDILQKLDIA